MRIGLDTNLIVEAHLPGLPRHEIARSFLDDQLAVSDVTLVVTPLVLHEVVHVVTDPRRFDPPLSMIEALTLARAYVGGSNVECLAVDEHCLVLALDLLQRHRLGRNRVADCLLAATLLANGVHRLATFNPTDFAAFDPLRPIEPQPRT